jgi:uncharacterized protein YoxC
MPDIFDQVASSMGVSQPSAPAASAPTQQSAQQSAPAPGAPSPASPAPASSAQPSGDIFDQVGAQHDGSFQAPDSGHTITPGQIINLNGHSGVAKGINPKTGKMIVDWGSKPRWNPFSAPEENTSEVSTGDLGDQTPNALGSFTAGVGSKLTQTAQGAAKIVHAPARAQSALGQSQQQLTDAKDANPLAGGAGSLAGDVLEFLAGGEALKPAEEALGSSELMSQAGKIAKSVEKFPKLAKALQVGLRAGTTQGAIGTVNSGGDLGEGIKEGVGTGLAGGTLSLAGSAIPAAYRALYPAELPDTLAENPQPIHEALHQGLRDVMDKVASDEGVQVKPATSIRDVVQNTSDAVKQKASGLYKQMDDVLKTMSDTGEDLPGRFQKFDEDIDKLTDKISDAIGEPEKQQQFAEALDQVKANKQIAINKIKEAGLPEDLPEQAAAIHKRARALGDLSKAVQSSTTGLRPEMAGSATDAAGATPERINPVQLSKNLNNLYDSTKYGGRRLVQAVGDGADDLLTHADSAKNALERLGDRATAQAEQAAKIATQRARAKTAALTAAGLTGLSSVVGAVTQGHHMVDAIKGAIE